MDSIVFHALFSLLNSSVLIPPAMAEERIWQKVSLCSTNECVEVFRSTFEATLVSDKKQNIKPVNDYEG